MTLTKKPRRQSTARLLITCLLIDYLLILMRQPVLKTAKPTLWTRRVEHSTDNEAPMPPTEPIPSSSGWNPKKKTFFNIGFFIILIVIGVFLILYAWKLPPFTPTVQHTNNAFVKGQTTIISSQVSGYVTDIAVRTLKMSQKVMHWLKSMTVPFNNSSNKHRPISR